jgi:hypothetical protein
MTVLLRISVLMLIAVPALVSAPFAQAVDVWTVGVNNTRQGWNKFETVLTPANVPNLRKIREFMVDEKIDVSPLVVGNRLYVFTMTSSARQTSVRGAVRPRRRCQPTWQGHGPPQHVPQLGDHGNAGD